MNLEKFFDYMNNGKKVDEASGLFKVFHALAQEALKITMEINTKYHSEDELVGLFSKLTGRKVDPSFRVFPPFYTDCGKNIIIGKNVFINSCCRFQDQGGIVLGDGCFIGHNITVATLNHDLNPEARADMYPKSVILGKNVWVGSDSTILPGVKIGDGAVVGAGSVVTKNVAANTVVCGNPARVLKKISL